LRAVRWRHQVLYLLSAVNISSMLLERTTSQASFHELVDDLLHR
jgi:hypothetical protein